MGGIGTSGSSTAEEMSKRSLDADALEEDPVAVEDATGSWIAVLTVPTSFQRYSDFLRASSLCSSVTERPDQSFLYARTAGCPRQAIASLSQHIGFTRTCTKLFACDNI